MKMMHKQINIALNTGASEYMRALISDLREATRPKTRIIRNTLRIRMPLINAMSNGPRLTKLMVTMRKSKQLQGFRKKSQKRCAVMLIRSSSVKKSVKYTSIFSRW